MSKPVDPAAIGKVESEHAQQVAVFVWAALNFQKYPELRMMFAIPNGGLRSKITAANLKAEGVRAHVPDIFLPIPRGKWHGLFIEMKKVGGRLDPGQDDYLRELRLLGYGACFCIGWKAAVQIIEDYLTFSA